MRGSVLLSTKHEAQSVVLDTPVRGRGYTQARFRFAKAQTMRLLYGSKSVQTLNSAINRQKNHYPTYKYQGHQLRYLVDRDLPSGQR